MSPRIALFIAILVGGTIAVGWPAAFGPPVTAQESGCTLSRRDVDGRTQRPIAGMQKTLIETGEVTHTDDDGVWSFRVTGAGTYTVASIHPDYEPLTRRYVLNVRCDITSTTVVTGAAAVSPSGTPAPAVTPMQSANPAGVHRFAGSLTIEGQPAPAGTRVSAYAGSALCGSGVVAAAGRYVVEVVSRAARADCGIERSPIQFAVTPAFGDGWRLDGTAPFAAGAASARDLAVDLGGLRPRADNVPWIDVAWAEPRSVAIGVCGDIAPTSEEALRGAIEQWQEAFRDRGLVVELVQNGDVACGELAPGIAVIEDDIRSRTALAGATHRTADLRPCPRVTTCAVFKSVIVINRPSFTRINAVERANVLAHEIGHAFGLDHAIACNGGTIMWKDTQCRYPLRSIGVDDIASLNEKIGGVLAKIQPAGRSPDDQDAVDVPVPSVLIAATLRAGAAPLLSRLPDGETLLDEATSHDLPADDEE